VIAIVGYKGFIGSTLYRYAQEHITEEVIGVDVDNYKQWAKDYLGWSTLVWAAGMSSKPKCNENKGECWKANVDDLRDALNDFNPHKVVYISSYDVYAPDLEHPSEEDTDPFSDEYVSKLSWYGRTKLAGEQVVKLWAEDYRKKYLITRCNGFTGAGLKKNVVYDLKQLPPKLYVAWDSRFQYLHTDRFAQILLNLSSTYSNEVFNVTAIDCVTPLEIRDMLDVFVPVCTPPITELPRINAVMDTMKMGIALTKMGMQLPLCKEAIKNWNQSIFLEDLGTVV